MDVRSGIYRHYKGNLYQVIGVAHDANADSLGSEAVLMHADEPGEEDWAVIKPLEERRVVVYFGLQLDEAKEGDRLAVRTLADWNRFVCWKNACGKELVRNNSFNAYECPDHGFIFTPVSRFQYLGPEFKKEMLG